MQPLLLLQDTSQSCSIVNRMLWSRQIWWRVFSRSFLSNCGEVLCFFIRYVSWMLADFMTESSHCFQQKSGLLILLQLFVRILEHSSICYLHPVLWSNGWAVMGFFYNCLPKILNIFPYIISTRCWDLMKSGGVMGFFCLAKNLNIFPYFISTRCWDLMKSGGVMGFFVDHLPKNLNIFPYVISTCCCDLMKSGGVMGFFCTCLPKKLSIFPYVISTRCCYLMKSGE